MPPEYGEVAASPKSRFMPSGSLGMGAPHGVANDTAVPGDGDGRSPSAPARLKWPAFSALTSARPK